MQHTLKIHKDADDSWHVLLGGHDISNFITGVAMQVTNRGAQAILEVAPGVDMSFEGLADIEVEAAPPSAPVEVSRHVFNQIAMVSEAAYSLICVGDCPHPPFHEHYLVTQADDTSIAYVVIP